MAKRFNISSRTMPGLKPSLSQRNIPLGGGPGISEGGSGATSIIQLTDVDDGDYTGDKYKFPMVNRAEDALNFTSLYDAVITASGSAATDLTNLNNAITDVAATSTAHKTIRVFGTFKIGATAPNSFDDITLIFDRVEVTGALAAVCFVGTRGKIIIGQLDVNGGSVSSAGMFQCQEVLVTVASGFGSNTVFGSLPGSSTHINNKIRVHNLSATAVYNFNASDFTGADVEITGTTTGSQTFASSDMIVRTVGPSSASTLTVSGDRVDCRIHNGGGAVVVSGQSCRLAADLSGSTTSLNISGDGTIVLLTGNVNTPSITCSGDNVKLVCQRITTQGVGVSLSGTGHNFDIAGGEFTTTSMTATGGHYKLVEQTSAAAKTWTLGTRNTWDINSAATGHKRTLATTALGTVVNLTMPGDASADAVEIAATCDNTTFNVILTAAGSGLQVMAGATGNKIFCAGDTAPTFETAAARYQNSTTFLNTSTGQITHYGIGPGKIVKHITAANIVALGAVTAGNISLGTLPISGEVTRGYILNLGDAATGVSTLTGQAGIAATPNLYVTEATVMAANAVSETLGTATVDHQATTAAIVRFSATENLDTLTGLANGVAVVLDYQE